MQQCNLVLSAPILGGNSQFDTTSEILLSPESRKDNLKPGYSSGTKCSRKDTDWGFWDQVKFHVANICSTRTVLRPRAPFGAKITMVAVSFFQGQKVAAHLCSLLEI